MEQYAVPADLVGGAYGRSEEILAQLADDVNVPPQFAAANTQAVLNDACVSASSWVRSYIRRSQAAPTDAQSAADNKFRTVVKAMHTLYSKRLHYGPANPYAAQLADVKAELENIRDGVQIMGETPQIQRQTHASSQDTPSRYDRSDDTSLLRSF